MAWRASLAQVIVRHRTDARRTQELVAHKPWTSRQAAPKWERGASEPSAAHLIALARPIGDDVR